ncbi:endonuclease domain-containing protein [Georgenia sp. AZ-5]|uniref:endonuclease domain-containing protein n=1 Tax=Georgenia sp. AZ-5 TaxID=3367526 RepID=UPI00375437CD
MTQGVYIARGECDHGDMIRAARLIAPGPAVLRGRSALWALGVRLADPTDPVEIAVPRDRRIRRHEFLRVTTESVHEAEMAKTPFGWATSPSRTAFDLARLGGPLQSAPLLDALVRATGVSRSEVEAVRAANAGARSSARVPAALDLVDPGAESLPESRLRVLLVLAGLPRPKTQVKICTASGEFVARVDLGWPERRVAVEYDGAYHDDSAQVARDRARLNALRAVGWVVLVVDRAQLARPDDVVEMVGRVLARARSRP